MIKFIKILLSWQVLALEAGLIAFICWPWANHWVSYGWIGVMVTVLLAELGNVLFSPKKQTWSNNTRDEALAAVPWRFWAMIVVWILFAFTLAGHFMTRLF
jgi:hypothetical protein